MTREPTGNLFVRGAEAPQKDKQAPFGSYIKSQGQRARSVSAVDTVLQVSPWTNAHISEQKRDKKQRACNYLKINKNDLEYLKRIFTMRPYVPGALGRSSVL